MAEFYVICQPGLEEELKSEIEEFWPYLIEKDSSLVSDTFSVVGESIGGLSFNCSEVIGYQVNFFSKLASRVLLRLAHFETTEFGKLKSKLSKLNLEPYFSKQPFRIEVAASKSKLNNEKRIYEVCQQVWGKQVADEAEFALFIRVFDDQFTLSIDTSGAHLHFRSQQKKIGEAPIRETLAAFMTRKLITGIPLSDLVSMSLTDPMAGSGTLLTEGSSVLMPNFARHFSFLNFKSCPKILKSESLQKNYPQFPTLFEKRNAYDLNEKMIVLLRESLQGSQSNIEQKDIFQSPPKGDGFLIVNPPYGERLKAQFSFRDLAQVLTESEFRRIGVLLPLRASQEFLVQAQKTKYRQIGNYRFKNGGIPVEFLILEFHAS